MPLPASGAISFDNLQTEFGNTNPIPLNEYYRGGTLVPNISVNNSVPTSGTISLFNFYNATNEDRIPAAFDINNITDPGGFSPVTVDTNQVTITGINTPITLNFGTSNAAVYFAGAGTGSTIAEAAVYVNGSEANTVTWTRFNPGQDMVHLDGVRE
jgi:hypothetical protein